jgi:hypothetical protein
MHYPNSYRVESCSIGFDQATDAAKIGDSHTCSLNLNGAVSLEVYLISISAIKCIGPQRALGFLPMDQSTIR